jgi:hypothetical protein
VQLHPAGINVTVEQGAGPLYSGRDLPFFLEPLPGENVSSADGGAARGWLQVPNRSNSTGGVCARARDNPPLAAMVACRALGWRGVARAGGAPPPADATAVGDSGVALSALACDGTEPGVLACNLTRVEANFTGCAPRARLVIECAQDPGGCRWLAAAAAGQARRQALVAAVQRGGARGPAVITSAKRH